MPHTQFCCLTSGLASSVPGNVSSWLDSSSSLEPMAPSALSHLSKCQDTYPDISDYAKGHWALSMSIFRDPVSITETFSPPLWKYPFFCPSALPLSSHPQPRKSLGHVSCFDHRLETTCAGKVRPREPTAPHSHNCSILSMSFAGTQFLHSPSLFLHIASISVRETTP